MARVLKNAITIADPDGGNEKKYELLLDEYGRVQWGEEGTGEDSVPPGESVRHKWRYWGGGMGERQDMGRGGYYYSENAYHGDAFALKPRPEIKTVTLTDNTVPVERMFEAEDASGNPYLYSLAQAKSFKVNLTGTPTLKETKTFTGPPTVFAQGKYTGNGTSQSISGLGFQPAVVIVKGDTAQYPVMKTADIAGNNSRPWYGSFVTTAITSLDADGFSVGGHALANSNGLTYYWYAWKAEAGLVATGTYVGDGTDNRNITGVGFKPALVHVLRDCSSDFTLTRLSSFEGDTTVRLSYTIAPDPNCIQALHGDGFQVGTNQSVNMDTVTYYWVALREAAGFLRTGTYEGNGQDARPITGLGFSPTYLIITSTDASRKPGAHRGTEHTGDSSQSYSNVADSSNWIESLDSDGFTVGSHDMVNTSGWAYHYVAFGSGGTLQVGKSAKWPDKWIVPGGDNADSQELTTVHDESGAGDDTWTTLYGLTARHFQRKGNKLGRATKRHVSLCSADDITNLDNWGSEYGGVDPVAISSPDVEITDLVEWGSELAVCATDGMYRFDGVALSRQELPLLHGLTDDDNGKNTLRYASWILYPSADGYWRWRYGEHIRVDSDTIPGHGPAKETSNEPVNLKHYGSDFCGDHIYHAAYDGVNFLLFHVRPVGEEVVWDCLVSTTNAIKTVYVTSQRQLVFGWGNDLAYIQLSQGGEPDGGNFGNASLITTVYLDEIILADDIDVRLRMLKVACRNSDAQYKWEVFASRDGGAFAKVGADITADGVTKLAWDPTANLTARRLRLKVVGTATGSFTPTATPPEIIGIYFYGETVPDDAEIIRAVVDLESYGRSPKDIKAELKARENAGVCRVRNPIDNSEEYVIIYQANLAGVRQRGHEEPTAGMMLLMRHGDTS
ncbi:MAG: hypothetical protein AMJ38_00550 [Dehalococcoidia bacterium DG_22]|nr:MAG: hypothetical protein AMJ38_00550 [Dehalococcoidia bacterium DG_22]